MARVVMQDGKVADKVKGATGGSLGGAALAEIGIYVVESAWSIDIPTSIEAAITLVLAAGLAWLAGYLTPPSIDDVPEVKRV